MKRSEMLKIIADKLSSMNPTKPYWDIKEQAIILLEIIEEKGMQPPETEIAIKGSACTWHYTFYDWDKE